jgi:hypothetical protein
MGEMKNAFKILVREPEGNRPLGKSRCRWEDNVKMDVIEIRREGVVWIRVARVGMC